MDAISTTPPPFYRLRLANSGSPEFLVRAIVFALRPEAADGGHAGLRFPFVML